MDHKSASNQAAAHTKLNIGERQSTMMLTPPPPPTPDTDEAEADSLTEVTGTEAEPLEPGENPSFNEPPTDSLAVFENGDGVTETTEEQRLCVHGVSEGACGGEPEESEAE